MVLALPKHGAAEVRLVQMVAVVACVVVVRRRRTCRLPRVLPGVIEALVHTELELEERVVRVEALSSDTGHTPRHPPRAGLAEEQEVVLVVHPWTCETL